MKAIVRLAYNGNNVLQYFDSVECESVLDFVESMNKQHGINTLTKDIEFIPNVYEVKDYLKRQRLFFSMFQIAVFKLTTTLYVDDIIFYDKLQLFTSESKTLYWIVGNGFSYLLPNKISFSIEALGDMIRDGASIYKININKGTIDDITKTIMERELVC